MNSKQVKEMFEVNGSAEPYILFYSSVNRWIVRFNMILYIFSIFFTSFYDGFFDKRVILPCNKVLYQRNESN